MPHLAAAEPTPAATTPTPVPASVVTPEERYSSLFGRAPSPEELARFERTRGLLELRLPARARRRVATIICRL